MVSPHTRVCKTHLTGRYWGAAVCDYLHLEDGAFESLPQALVFRAVCMLVPLTLTYSMVPDVVERKAKVL